ncbi:alpha/beta hydrolase family protein [Bacillus marasmi]|uniref:alpha/beta hydrolase family protein n=1 Tax=Bacillus marasmi TaxID=1926279 RepID=UPI0011CB5E4C|nr:hypothetical protein [Bacillus marasmi]
MLGNLIILGLIFVEIAFVVWGIRKKSNLSKEKSLVQITLFLLFFILVLTPFIDWGFAWYMIGIVLGIQALVGIYNLVCKKENISKKPIRIVVGFIGRVMLIVMAVLPVQLFPQYDQIEPTGDYKVLTKNYTLTDLSRKEEFTEDANDNRNVTIQFWYPDVKAHSEAFPLVIFSHGAFGLRSSNYSTYQELASNGYVVCSIDHTYHAFMTEQTDGKRIITNMDFMNDAMMAQNGELSEKEIYQLEQDWMELRTGDMAFVLDYVKEHVKADNDETIYSLIDLDHIGTFGHSLGGATSAQIGREDADVDAVVVIDGTMLGEIIDFKDGKTVITNEPYPKPILNLFAEGHYQEAKKDSEYANTVAMKNAIDSYQVVIEGSDHMNFTDLPIISPILAGMLGTGSIDARECIQTTNNIILQFFDKYLKSEQIKIQKEQVFKVI